MGIIAGKLDIDFVISTGDNFYDDGLTDENDPAFEESFSNIYTAPSLRKQWYTGNYILTPLFTIRINASSLLKFSMIKKYIKLI